MKTVMRMSILSIVIMSFVGLAFAQQGTKDSGLFDWGPRVDPTWPLNSPNAKNLPLIKVGGTRFVNARGDTVLFRGLAIADPDKLAQEGRWNKELFASVKSMGAMIVRIPVHPVPWRMRTPAKYVQLLDQAVDWCTDLGLYVMIDWHSIGNLGMELFQDPVYNTTQRETYEFWRTIASRYRGHHTIAFYELFNEPTLYFGRLGSMSWTEWKTINENIIRLIRAYDTETIPLVAGLDWAYDLTPLHIEPIAAEGIGYVTHPYPHKRSKPWEPKWDEDFGFAAGRYPVVATEFGFDLGKQGMADNGEYGRAIIKYLEERGMSWICWVYDPLWRPQMLKSWDRFVPTEAGEFFKQAMQGKLSK